MHNGNDVGCWFSDSTYYQKEGFQMLKVKTIILLLLSILILLFSSRRIGFSQQIDISGDWEGFYYIPISGYSLVNYTITQTGNDFSGTYTTNRTSGSFQGTIDGTDLTFSVKQDTPSECQGEGTGTGKVDEEVMTFLIDWYECTESGKITGLSAITRNRIDADPWIGLSKIKYPWGEIEGSLWGKIIYPDIKSATLVTPLGEEIALAQDDGSSRWVCSIGDFPGEYVSKRFPDGIYYFKILLNDDTKCSDFSIITGDFPDQFPNITYPANGEKIKDDEDLTVTWEQWKSSPNTDYNIYFNSINESLMLEPYDTQIILPHSDIEFNNIYEIRLQFNNNTFHRGSKQTVTIINFSTGSFILDTFVGLCKNKLPSGNIGYSFAASAQGISFKKVSLTSPLGKVMELELFTDNEWWVTISEDSQQKLETRFPDGEYRFDIILQDNSTESKTVQLDGDFPEGFLDFTSHENNVSVDYNNSLKIVWESSQTSTYFAIYQYDSLPDETGINIISNGIRIWEEYAEPKSSSVSLPQGVLTQNNIYEAKLISHNFNDNGGLKAAVSSLFFTTTQESPAEPPPNEPSDKDGDDGGICFINALNPELNQK